MEEIILNSIKDATREITLAFLNMEIKEGPAFIRKDETATQGSHAETTAIVGFQGSLSGGVHLAAPLHVALVLASALADEKIEEFNSEARDAFMEIANMIAGGVQTKLSEDDRAVALVPPILIHGVNCGMYYREEMKCLRQYFQTAHGPFFVQCYY
ncbi:MAG: chemotaxis protein CheX [Magnetococcales bacterium]|nr:chemotaxis protein CheX [Magnetococcales bacterium]